MTTNEIREMIEATDTIARLIVDSDDLDHLALVQALALVLPAIVFTHLCELLDVCVIHHCDVAICFDDDEPECRDYRRRLRADTN